MPYGDLHEVSTTPIIFIWLVCYKVVLEFEILCNLSLYKKK